MGAVKEMFMDRCQEWADDINRYGLEATDEEVAEICHTDKWYMDEIAHNSFTDTMPREAMAGAIAKARIGMEVPCYGDSDEYQKEYETKMKEWLNDNREVENV